MKAFIAIIKHFEAAQRSLKIKSLFFLFIRDRDGKGKKILTLPFQSTYFADFDIPRSNKRQVT